MVPSWLACIRKVKKPLWRVRGENSSILDILSLLVLLAHSISCRRLIIKVIVIIIMCSFLLFLCIHKLEFRCIIYKYVEERLLDSYGIRIHTVYSIQYLISNMYLHIQVFFFNLYTCSLSLPFLDALTQFTIWLFLEP